MAIAQVGLPVVGDAGHSEDVTRCVVMPTERAVKLSVVAVDPGTTARICMTAVLGIGEPDCSGVVDPNRLSERG